MERPLRVALLGCGALADLLTRRVYPQIERSIKVVAVVDQVLERAGAIGRRLSAPGFVTLEQAAAAADIEAVDVRLPHHLHVQGARLSAQLGLPFIVEKPMASSLDDAREIAALARRVPKVCAVSENYGFLEPVRAARDLLHADMIGELLTVQSVRVFKLGEQWRNDGWRLAGTGAAGVLVDQAPHVARLLRTVIGEIDEVYAYAGSHHGGISGEDSAAVACRFASGHVGTQVYCWACPTREAIPELALYGTEGSITVHINYEGRGGGALLQRPGAHDEWRGTGTNYYDSLAAVLEDWAGALRGDWEPKCTIAEGLADMAVLEAIRQSIITGTPASPARNRALTS
jgi:predicted dehydrogenase